MYSPSCRSYHHHAHHHNPDGMMPLPQLRSSLIPLSRQTTSTSTAYSGTVRTISWPLSSKTVFITVEVLDTLVFTSDLDNSTHILGSVTSLFSEMTLSPGSNFSFAVATIGTYAFYDDATNYLVVSANFATTATTTTTPTTTTTFTTTTTAPLGTVSDPVEIDANVFTFSVTFFAQGVYDVSILAGTYFDEANNKYNVASDILEVTYDATPPTVVKQGSHTISNAAHEYTLDLIFTENLETSLTGITSSILVIDSFFNGKLTLASANMASA